MYKRLVLSFLMAFFVISMFATDYTLNLGDNVLKGYDSANCTFTPSKDGKVIIESQETLLVSYNGDSYGWQFTPGSGLSYLCEIDNVKAGSSVKLTSDFVMNTTCLVRVSMMESGHAIPVEAVNFVPKRNEVFNWNNTGMVTINFNKAVTLDAIKFVVGDFEADVEEVHVGSSVSCNISKALNATLKDGRLKSGEKFTIRIKGLRDANDATNLYKGSGELEFEYVAPQPQHNFLKATVGETELTYMQENAYKFRSFYLPNEEDGLFLFEFDGTIGKVGDVYMTMGNLDLSSQGKYHRSQLPYTIEGNKLLVDARGQLRTLAVLFPAIVEDVADDGVAGEGVTGDFDKSHVTIALSNVIDANGNAFLSDVPGSVGSYYFQLGYEEIIDEAYIDGDNVTDGDVVHEGQSISLWLSNADIKFNGIAVTYFVREADAEGVEQMLPREIVVSDFTIENDPVQGIIIRFVLPVLPDVVPNSTIRVALNNASSTDGMPHFLYIEFKAPEATDAMQHVDTPVVNGKTYQLNGIESVTGKQGHIVVKQGKKVVR